MNKTSLKRILIVLSILFLPSLLYLLLITGKHQFRKLPVFGPVEVSVSGDTTYHTIPAFSLINQEGKMITEKDLEGKIYVANFFFASCPDICPKMTGYLARIQKEFMGNEGLKIISHTVDPEHDSISVLKEYALKHGSDNRQWWFLTGVKDSIYSLARSGYLVSAAEGKTAADFFHSQDLMLIDKERRIRGIYDGLESADVDTLIDEIKVLFKEYEAKK